MVVNAIEIIDNEYNNFLKLTESLDVLEKCSVLTEDTVIEKYKDIVSKSAKKIWISICNFIDTLKYMIHTKFEGSIKKSWKNISVNISKVIDQKESNDSIYNKLVERISEEVYGIVLNDRETYLKLDEKDQDIYSIKNMFHVVYEAYKKVPKKVRFKLNFNLFNPDKSTSGFGYTIQSEEGSKLYEIAKDNYYAQLEKIFGSRSQFKVDVKKYTDDEVTVEEELNILKRRVESSIGAMTEIETPYKEVIKDQDFYKMILEEFITSEMFSNAKKENYDKYKRGSTQLLEDLNFYKTMIHLYSAVFGGLLKETFANMMVANKMTNSIGKLKAVIQ